MHINAKVSTEKKKSVEHRARSQQSFNAKLKKSFVQYSNIFMSAEQYILPATKCLSYTYYFFSIKTLLHMTRSNIHITTKNISNVYVNIFRTSFLTLPSWFLHIFSHYPSVIIRNLLDTIQKRHRRRLLQNNNVRI